MTEFPVGSSSFAISVGDTQNIFVPKGTWICNREIMESTDLYGKITVFTFLFMGGFSMSVDIVFSFSSNMNKDLGIGVAVIYIVFVLEDSNSL